MNEISIDQFSAVDIRIGRVVRTADFPKARKPAYQLWIDFGELGVRQSSAQLTHRYQREALEGRLIVAIVNLPSRQIADFRSDVLVLGAVDGAGDVILLQPDQEDVALGARIA